MRDDVLQSVLDALDQALIVLDGPAVIYANQAAERSVLVEDRRLVAPLREAATAHRASRLDLERHGIRAPAQPCALNGSRWFVRTIGLPRGLDLVACSREVMREIDLLRHLQGRYRLTNRQADVLRHLIRGTATAEAAQALGVTVKTIYGYQCELRQALGTANNLAVVRMANQVRYSSR